jgi:hypothetical protein
MTVDVVAAATAPVDVLWGVDRGARRHLEVDLLPRDVAVEHHTG